MTPTDPAKLREIVAKWLYIKAKGDRFWLKPGYIESFATPTDLLNQLGHDAWHSSLLLRMFSGEEPLPQPPIPEEDGESVRILR